MTTLHFVSHTHWDREWYEPFQVFRTRLVRCIDKLLDLLAADQDYRYFLLDGQTIVLQDYGEVRPDRTASLREFVQSGRIQIGPWYVLPDEFLVSGESLIRNLLVGEHVARDYGAVMPIGYIPDPFGHISQMPQVLRGMGIDVAVFRRGLADEPTEVWWDASDGTRVLACYLRDSYDNAAGLAHEPEQFAEGIKGLRDSLAPYAVTGNLLLMNGTDHMEPWQDLPRLLHTARNSVDDADLVHSSLPMYVQRVQNDIASTQEALIVVRGELRNPKRHHLLPGVASARMWIKQQNARAQMLLERWAEPAAAFASAGHLRAPVSATHLLRQAWKYLLQNHPHDSICGCGVDATHADMQPRFEWVEQIGNKLTTESLTAFSTAINTAGHPNTIPLVVFNAAGRLFTDCVHTTVELNGGWEDLSLFDDQGNEISYRLINRKVVEYYHARATAAQLGVLLGAVHTGRAFGMVIQDAFVRANHDPIYLDVTLTSEGDANQAFLDKGVKVLQDVVANNETATFEILAHSPVQSEIEFVARDVPGHGYRAYYLARSENDRGRPTTDRGASQLENEFFSVVPSPTDGTVSITDKKTGTVYHAANHFVDGGDRGDLYNYCPPDNDLQVGQPSHAEIRIQVDAVKQSAVIDLHYQLPARIANDRRTRSTETVDEHIVTTVSLYPGVPRVDFRTVVDNRARDHRLRVEFPTPIKTDHASVEQAFDVVDRKLDVPADTAGWIEQPRPEAPMQTFVSVGDGEKGLMLATRGLPEYEVHRDSNGVTVALTLLRCVDRLSRGDLSTRTGDAGPGLETPGAQELGTHTFEYALIPHSANLVDNVAHAHAFAAPMRAITAEAHAGSLPPTASLIETAPKEFIVSTVKLPEVGDGLIVRGYNIGDREIVARVSLWRRFGSVARTNLKEEIIAPLEWTDDQAVEVHVRPKEIVTLRFED